VGEKAATRPSTKAMSTVARNSNPVIPSAAPALSEAEGRDLS
jgi:hypothetical protein